MSVLEVVQEVSPLGGVSLMDHAGFKAKLMRANRLKGDIIHALPPGENITVFPISTLPGCPESWVREAGTYVCPVDTEWGLWFDWRNNSCLNTAIMPSVKGMNPITGQKIEGFGMEMYADKCPVHDIPFSHGRICEECGYEWPAQNYVCSPGELWWDGFRQPDGSVRQFFFTDEDKRDVASAVIGKENTVPAFGFAFYKTKVSREPKYTTTRSMSYSQPTNCYYGATTMYNYSGEGALLGACEDSSEFTSCNSVMESEEKTSGGIIATQGMQSQFTGMTGSTGTGTSGASGHQGPQGARGLKGIIKKKSSAPTPKKSKSVSVGAGARIDQELAMDDLGLDGWQDEHSGVIRLYFCFEEEFKEIIKKGGVKEIKSNTEGYLKDLPVG